jgi:hypothetical protein
MNNDDEDSPTGMKESKKLFDALKIENMVREMICELVLPLDRRVKEGKEFDEVVVKKQFTKINHRLEVLSDKLQGENIKIWAPFLETLIDKRLELVDVSH